MADLNPAKCDLGLAVEVMAARWKGDILWFLRAGPKRFTELRALIPAVSPKVLTQKLRELESHGLVARTQHAEIPPRVEYAMTPIGDSVIPILDALAGWWRKHGQAVLRSQAGARRRR